MAVFATIPRNLMVSRKMVPLSKLVYGFYSMVLVGHKEQDISCLDLEKFMPFSRQQIIRYSEDLAARHFINFRYDDFFYYVSIPETVHAALHVKADRTGMMKRRRQHKDCDYVAKTVMDMHGEAFYGSKKPKVTDAILEKVNARLKSYQSGEIIDACQNRIEFVQADKWWNKEENKKFKKNIMNLLNTEDKLEKWLHIDMSTVANNDTLTGLKLD